MPVYIVLFLLIIGLEIKAQNPLVIGEGSESVSAPLALNYYHSYTQTIYLKSELANIEGKPITKLAYHVKENREILENIDIYIGYTLKDSFAGETVSDWVDLNSLQKYYEGRIIYNEEGWGELELTTPFTYDSTNGNLLIAVNVPQKRIWWQSINFNGTKDPNSLKRVLIYRNDNTAFDLSNPQKPSTSSAVCPNIKLYYKASGSEINIKPWLLDFGAIQESDSPMPMTKTVTLKNAGSQDLVVTGISDINSPFSSSFTGAVIEPSVEINVDITMNTASIGNFEQNITFISNAENQDASLQLKGEVYRIGSRPVIVGLEEDPAKAYSVPFSFLHNYSYSQVIYLSSELSDIIGMQITKLGYHLYRNASFSNPINEDIFVYIGYTDKNSFTSKDDWESENKLVECYKGKFTLKDEAPYWGEIELDRPFVYDGSKNIIIAVYTPERRSWTQNLNFYASTSNTNRTLSYVHGATAFNPTSPQSGNMLLTAPNTRFYYSVLPEGAVLELTQNEIDFDYLEVGKTVTQTLQVRNNGTRNLILSNINTINAPFSTNFTENTNIEPYQSAEIAFSFSPTTVGDFQQEAISFTHNAISNETFSLKGKAYAQGSLLESFESNILPPNYWRTNTRKWALSENAFHGNSAAALNSITDTLITPLVSGNFSLYAKQQGTSGQIKILYSNDLETWIEVLGETPLAADFVEYSVNIPATSFVGITGSNIVIDLVKAEQIFYPDKDLLISSWAVPEGLKENTNVNIPVIVKNWGTSTEDVYNVYLKNGETNEVLLSSPGVSIAPLEEKMITLDWNPQPNVKSIYAEVELIGDEDATNSKSSKVSVSITPYLGVIQVTPSSELDFGLLKNNGETKEMTVKLKNTGIAQLIINSIQLDVPFSTTLKAPASLDVDEERTITIIFAPTQSGAYLDTLRILHDGVNGITKIPLNGELLKKGDLYEDFENVEFPPFMWSLAGTGWTRKTNPVYEGKAVAYLDSSSKPDTLITPKLDVKTGDKISFYARHWAGSSWLPKMFLSIMTSPDMRNWTTIRTYTQDDLTTTYQNYKVELPVEGNLYVAFVAQTEVIIDLVRGPKIIYPEHDLAVKALIGSLTGAVNSEASYVLTVVNQGSTDETDYEVRLINGEETLVTVDGVLMPSLEQMDIHIPWTPRKAGDYKLQVVIESQADENIDNNDSEILEVIVEPENSKKVEVGTTVDAVIQSDIPLVRNWKYSFTETLYFPEELSMRAGTTISEVGYKYYLGVKYDVTTPVRVWIGETELTNFSSTMVQVKDLMLVYSSEHTFMYNPATTFNNPSTAWFELDSDYTYKGGNLVVVVESNRISLGTATPYINFYENSSLHTPRALYYRADSNPINPEEIVSLDDMTKKTNGLFPVTLLKYSLPGIKVFGSLQDENELPFGDASVSLISDNIEYKTMSDVDGNFDLDVYSLDREYILTVEKEGFDAYNQTVTVYDEGVDLGVVVMVKPSENTEFTLQVTSAMGISLEGTPVALENDETGMVYRRNIPADGKIEYGAIKKGRYLLSIHKENHMPYVNNNLILDKNKFTLQVELQENVVTPYGLLTDVAYSEQTGKGIVSLSWNNDVDAFYDDFENHNDFDISFVPWTGLDLDNDMPVRMDINFRNATERQYAIIFNPLNTQPPRWGFQEMMPYEGYKCVAFMRTQNVPNNDWLIAPKKMINDGDVVSFMARSLGVNYPTENFRVAVSTKSNTDVNDFTIISNGNNESVGADWTKFTYDLSSYAGQEIYVAINYTSVFKQMMFVDNFFIGRAAPEFAPKARRISNKTNSTSTYPEYVIYYNDEEKARVKDTYYTLSNVDGGEYKVGVKAVYKTKETQTINTTVYVDELTHFASITINVETNNNKPADGAKAIIYNSENNLLYEKTITDGKVEIPFARKGDYTLTVHLVGYEDYSDEFSLTESKTINIDLKELKGAPYNLTIEVTKNTNSLYDATFRWNQELGWSDGFESYSDFSSTFTPWTVFDLDGVTPYKLNVMLNGGARDILFPGAGVSSAPMIFNPSNTSPSIDMLEAAYAPEGSKYVAFFSACMAASDDWLISPKLIVKDNYVLRFSIKAYEVYGVEDLSEVLDVSISETNTDISSFAVNSTIKPSNQQWSIMEIDLSDYVGKEIHIGFHYKSVDRFILQLDDIYVGPSASNIPIGEPTAYEVYLGGELAGRTNENTYTFTDLRPQTTYKAGVKALYVSGATSMIEIEFTTPDKGLGVDYNNIDKFKVYPTLVTNGYFTVSSLEIVNLLNIYDVSGQLVKRVNTDNQTMFNVDVRDMSEGVYYIKVNYENSQRTEKIIIK